SGDPPRCPLRLCVAASRPRPALHSFPTRRSSDLRAGRIRNRVAEGRQRLRHPDERQIAAGPRERDVCGSDAETEHEGLPAALDEDRKSTRLNSSHRTISYAVFCLKKKMIRDALVS